MGKPEHEAVRIVWSLFRILCEVHIKDYYQTFSLQRKGDRENLKEWLIKLYGDEPIQQTPIEAEKELDANVKKKQSKRKIKLIDAARACKRIKLGRRKKDSMIDICTNFLENNEIIGKLKYPPSKLSNYISQVRHKL
jgi:hypothetical protein